MAHQSGPSPARAHRATTHNNVAADGASVTAAPAVAAIARRRDAAQTRRLLLDAARRRFADDGYAATTVRDIAADAGVNVALINRYFVSKEGLFQACLIAGTEDLRAAVGEVSCLAHVPAVIARQITGAARPSQASQMLRLLLRSSGDERAEEIRIDTLRFESERLAILAGWSPQRPDEQDLELRAQLLLCACVGIAVLRDSPGLEPLASASEQRLTSPLADLLGALLRAPGAS